MRTRKIKQGDPGAKGSKSTLCAKTTSNTATFRGTDQTLEKGIADYFSKFNLPDRVVVTPDLGASKAFFWFLFQLSSIDISQLAQLELTDDANGGQAVAGSVLQFTKDDGSHYYHLRGRVVGPFPCIQSHEYSFSLRNADEAIIWILAHELCHFLKRTAQLEGENDEASACEFADEWLEAFRDWSLIDGPFTTFQTPGLVTRS